MKRLLFRMLQSVILIVLLSWAGLAFALYFLQPKLIYFPHKELQADPKQAGLEYRDILFHTRDGLALHAWYIPHPDERGKVLFLHGNAGNISHRLESIKIFHDLGLSVFIFDYRGYGKSDGRPSEQGTYLDALAAWDYLDQRLNKDKRPVYIFGRSLGGAIASWLAAEVDATGVILESTFTSIMDMGKHYYPYLPIRLITRIRYDSLSRIQHINSPVLIIHSPDDEIVPYKFARTLFDNANANKTFVTIAGDHNTGFLTSGGRYIQALDRFFRQTAH